MVSKSKTFWIATGLFLIVGLGIIWFIFPPILSDYRAKKETLASLTATYEQNQTFLDNVKKLKADPKSVADLYESSQAALPVKANGDFLLLQLEGLTNSLGITGATLTAPLPATPVAASPAPATSTAPTTSPSTDSSNSSDVKQGSNGSSAPASAPTTSTPTTTGTQTQLTFSIAGDFGFDKAVQLLVKLQSFGRWNKLTAFNLTTSGDKASVTLSAQVFTKPLPSGDFSGDGQLLDKAKQLFASYQNYTSTPNSTSEGSFGRTDPFAPVH